MVDEQKRTQIRNLLFVIGSGCACGLLLVAWMLYSYNPSGRYLAQNVLLSPQIMSQITYRETDRATGSAKQYIFQGFQFGTYDPATKQWKWVAVNGDAYSQFYGAVSGDLSDAGTSDAVRRLFQEPDLPLLRARMMSGSAHAKEALTFQEAQFASSGEYYRVQLRQQALSAGEVEGWAYFYHPGITSLAMKLFEKA